MSDLSKVQSPNFKGRQGLFFRREAPGDVPDFHRAEGRNSQRAASPNAISACAGVADALAEAHGRAVLVEARGGTCAAGAAGAAGAAREAGGSEPRANVGERERLVHDVARARGSSSVLVVLVETWVSLKAAADIGGGQIARAANVEFQSTVPPSRQIYSLATCSMGVLLRGNR